MNQANIKDGGSQNEDFGVHRASISIEPEFLVSNKTNLQLGTVTKTRETAQYIDYQVVRRPQVLSNHVKRILLYVDLANADRLYGALIDLFIVLDGRGDNLRQRMLQASCALLDKERLNALEACEGRIGLAGGQIPDSKASLLNPGLVGTSVLLNSFTEQIGSGAQRDPLVEAREYIEYSQIELARSVLEKAILEDPNRQELQVDLLEIIRSTGDKDCFDEFYKKLNTLRNPHADLWVEFSNRLDKVE